ncbi:flavodoxin family protein [Blastococcus sp. SYSU DS0539]
MCGVPGRGGQVTGMTGSAPLRALALACSLKRSPAPSSSDLIARQVLAELAKHGVTGNVVRVVDSSVLPPGVEVDMGEGDEWPAIRERMMAADILIVSTPTWVGHMSSVAHRVLERLDGSCRRPTGPAARWSPARWRWCPSSATRTARTRSSPTCSRAWTTSVPPSRRRGRPTGTTRRWAAPTTWTWRRPPRPSPPRPRRWRRTPPTCAGTQGDPVRRALTGGQAGSRSAVALPGSPARRRRSRTPAIASSARTTSTAA